MNALRPKTNAVVIGGTGMLADATDWLAGCSKRTLLVARHATQAFRARPEVRPLDADWNTISFEKQVTDSVLELQPIGRALIWIHDPQPVLTWLLPLMDGAHIVVILGSTDGRPTLPTRNGDCVFVQLGSKTDGLERRWLTHREISDAAIAALRDGKSSVVGDLRPLH